MPDDGDAPRLIARLVALDPAVNGADNVQDALEDGGGGVQLGNNGDDVATQTASTALDADGAEHDVTCVITVPPDWMDDAGNIIAAGLYQFTLLLTGDTGPTTSALYISAAAPGGAVQYVPFDALGTDETAYVNNTVAIGVDNLPYGVVGVVTMPTDVTGAALGKCVAARLAYPAA